MCKRGTANGMDAGEKREGIELLTHLCKTLSLVRPLVLFTREVISLPGVLAWRARPFIDASVSKP